MDDEKRNTSIHILVSKNDQRRIRDNMERAGIKNMSAYIRKQAINGYVVQLDLAEIREFVRLLRNVSNNMNQIARRANETRSIYEADIIDLQKRYDNLWRVGEDIMNVLSEL